MPQREPKETCLATASVCRRHGVDATRRSRHRSPDRYGIGHQIRRLAPWKIRRLRAFVEEHLSDPIRIPDLSDLVGLSVPHFSRAFRQSFDEPPHAYVTQRRLDRARSLMLTSDLALIEVAVSCGFSDQAHFCKVFRRETGRTPAAWRRERACRDPG